MLVIYCLQEEYISMTARVIIHIREMGEPEHISGKCYDITLENPVKQIYFENLQQIHIMFVTKSVC